MFIMPLVPDEFFVLLCLAVALYLFWAVFLYSRSK